MFFQAHGISDTLWQMYRPLAYRDTWSVIPMLLRPKSRGRVLLRSNNPYDKPIFHAGYFTHPEDIKVDYFNESFPCSAMVNPLFR